MYLANNILYLCSGSWSEWQSQTLPYPKMSLLFSSFILRDSPPYQVYELRATKQLYPDYDVTCRRKKKSAPGLLRHDLFFLRHLTNQRRNKRERASYHYSFNRQIRQRSGGDHEHASVSIEKYRQFEHYRLYHRALRKRLHCGRWPLASGACSWRHDGVLSGFRAGRRAKL
jgi:hypothetical protein